MKILYLCTGNSARSQMAEAFSRSIIPSNAPIEVFSAGTEPAGLHPETVAVMEEVGVDMSAHRSKSTGEVPFDAMDIVVTLCDSASASCPVVPEGCRRIHWSLRDPASSKGSPEEVRRSFREVREDVLACVKRLMFELAMNKGRPRG